MSLSLFHPDEPQDGELLSTAPGLEREPLEGTGAAPTVRWSLPPLTPAELAGPDGTLRCDLLCATCGYNLRTLALDGRCPECGDSVQMTVARDPLYLYDPGVLRRVSRAVFVAALGLIPPALVTLFPLLVTYVPAAFAAYVGDVLLVLAALVGLAMAMIGVLVFTLSLPSGHVSGGRAVAARDDALGAAPRTPVGPAPAHADRLPSAGTGDARGGPPGPNRLETLTISCAGASLMLTLLVPLLELGASGFLGGLPWLVLVWLAALLVTGVTALDRLRRLLARVPGRSPTTSVRIAQGALLLDVLVLLPLGACLALQIDLVTVWFDTAGEAIVEAICVALGVPTILSIVIGWRAYRTLRRAARLATTLRAGLAVPASAPADGPAASAGPTGATP